jgi:drug/metabolite transporter (DMT)-like permease
LSPLGPQASAFWRLTFALPALGLWAIAERRGQAASKNEPMPWLLLGLAGFLFAGDLATWHAGIVRTSAANATFLSNLTPIVVVIFTWVMTRATPTRGYWVAVVTALTGSLLLSGGAPGNEKSHLIGDGLSALTSVWYGLYFLVIAKLRERLGAGTIMLVSSACAAILCGAFTLWSGEPLVVELGTRSWLAVWWPLIVLGLVAQVGGQGLLAVGFGIVPTHIASVLVLWQPVLAGILGWALLHEALGPVQMLGAGLVLMGVYLAKRAG